MVVLAGCQNNTLGLKHCKGEGWIYVVWQLKKTITSTTTIAFHAFAFCATLLAGANFEDIGVFNRYDVAEKPSQTEICYLFG